MANRFHISSDGTPKKCKAQKNNCPLGGSHFSSQKEAQQFYENLVNEQLNIPNTINCDEYYTQTDYDERSKKFVESLNGEYSEIFIKDYVQEDYTFANESLWNDGNDYFNSTVNNILSQTHGDAKSLWRMPPADSVYDLVEGKKVGDKIELKGFTSTSESPRCIMPMMINHTTMYMNEVPHEEWEREGLFGVKVPDEYLKKDPNIVFQFVTPMGKEVSQLSHMPQEKEVLLPARTQWKIVGIKKNISFSTNKSMFGQDDWKNETAQATVYQLMEA